MIQGRFVKNGELTEVIIGNGMTELIHPNPERELQVFTIEPKEKKKEKTAWTYAKEIILVLSVIIPFLFYMGFFVSYFAEYKAFALGFILSQVWVILFVYANAKK